MKKLLSLIALFGVLAVACNNSSNDPGLNVPSGPSIAKIDEQMASIEASLPKLQKSVDEAKALVAEPMSETRGDDNNGVKTMIEALEERIAALEEYIASGGEGDWMDTTYATLDMYEETIALLAELQAEIDALKGQNDAQYEDVLESIEESVDSMKLWVNELLTGYYDIATIDAMFAKLLEGLSADDAAIRSEIEALRKELDKQFDDMEDAYRDAIREAIEENNGKLSEQLTKEIEAVNSRIDDEVEKLNKRLDDIEERLSQLEDSVSDLLKRIQSITYIPLYDDNTARVLCPNEGLEGSTVQLDFTISPRDAAEDLAAVWQEAVSVKALYTGSPVMTDLPVVSCTAYADQGLLSVVAACDNLSWEFYNEDVKARAIMYISDGNNDLTSEYIPMIPQRSQIPNNQIWYTVTGKTPVDIQQGSGPKIVSNTFDPSNEVYVVTFEEAIYSIPADYFGGKSELKSVVLPNSVSLIADYAFSGCYSLSDISLGMSLSYIGSRVFEGCAIRTLSIPASLRHVNPDAFAGSSIAQFTGDVVADDGISLIIDKTLVAFAPAGIGTEYSVPAEAESIGKGVFRDFSGVKQITIHDKVSSIGKEAFKNCGSLTSIAIPDSVKSIGSGAFTGCNNLNTITIGAGLTEIVSGLFSNLNNLENITIGSGVTKIGDNAFKYCDSLTSIAIPDSVKSIGSGAFTGCNNLNTITIGAGLTEIVSGLFSNLNNLKNITIGSGVTKIGDNAFKNCGRLTSIAIPDSVKSIGSGIFAGCTSLKSISLGANIGSINKEMFTGCNSIEQFSGKFATEDGYALVSNGTLMVFAKACGLQEYTISANITHIEDRVFANCTNISLFRFESTTPPTLGEGVFDGIENLQISIPKEAVEAYLTCDWPYDYRRAIIELADINNIPDNCRLYYTTNDNQKLGVYPVDGCTVLSHNYTDGVGMVVFFEPLTTIGDRLFYGCKSLTSVTIPDSVTTIGNSTFQSCSNLTSVTIGYSVTTIGNYAFCHCSSLTSVTIPDSVQSIGNVIFAGCSSLKSISLSANIESINKEMFTGCDSIEQFSGKFATEDGYALVSNGTLIAFAKACGIDEYTIPADITYIEERVFANCTNISLFRFESTTPPTLGANVFAGIDNLQISIPKEAVEAYLTCDWPYDYRRAIIELADINNIPDSYRLYYTTNNNQKLGVYSVEDHTVLLHNYTDGVGMVVFFKSLTTIGDRAFENCKSLTSVTMPNSVTTIGAKAFCNCSSLTSITIPDSVTTIGSNAFSGCSSLISITIPDSVTTIGGYAFYNCSSLTSVTIPDSVTTIGDRLFYGCKSLESVTIPDSVTSIGYAAFYNCISLASVYISDIAAWCNISFSDSYTNPLSNGCNLYLNNELVTDLTIPDSVTAIGDYVFYGCSSLTSLTIPDSVTTIGYAAFENCNSLASVNIPDSVTTIGDEAFIGCSSLTSVTIGDSVTTIGSSAFRGCSSLTSITIPDSVTTIGDGAFRGCSSLTSITIPDSVTTIGEYAFYNCSNLASVTIGYSVTTIGNYAFYGCGGLASVTIGDSVTTIGGSAFYNCSSLTSVTIPDSVTSIGGSAFYNCSRLTSVTIPDSVTTIGDEAFRGCSNLPSVTIPDSVTTIGDYAFYNCSSLTSVTIGDSVTMIGGYAFQYCSSLTSVTIPDSVTMIGELAFEGCSSLTSVTIGDSVTTIGEWAFFYCSNLTSVYCKATTPPAGSYDMFSYNASGRKIYVPMESVEAYKSASYWKEYADAIVGYNF